jgi:adenine-specific DNA-methyltransferase
MRAQQLPLLSDDLGFSSIEPESISTCSVPVRPAELQLVRLAIDLGALGVGGRLTPAEQEIADQAGLVTPLLGAGPDEVRSAILAGADPLGEALCQLRPISDRRAVGAFYTQPALVGPMLDWVLARRPNRLVDAGCGSGRFAAGAVRRQSDLAVVAVDIDPIATLLARAALAVLEAQAATVLQADYAAIDLPAIAGRTAYVGNPPYVRHHSLTASHSSFR